MELKTITVHVAGNNNDDATAINAAISVYNIDIKSIISIVLLPASENINRKWIIWYY